MDWRGTGARRCGHVLCSDNRCDALFVTVLINYSLLFNIDTNSGPCIAHDPS